MSFADVPVHPLALELVQAGFSPGAAERNWTSYGHEVRLPEGTAEWQRKLLCDPQTSGGLMVACEQAAIPTVLAEMSREGFSSARVIGMLERIEMPGAEIIPGECRMQVPVPVPASAPALAALLRPDSAVELAWPRTAETIGLQYELHRGPQPEFTPDAATQIGLTTAGRFVDLTPPVGRACYALVVTSGTRRSRPKWVSIDVTAPVPPGAPTSLVARPLPGEVALPWEARALPGARYEVYRARAGTAEFAKLNGEPLARVAYSDFEATAGTSCLYAVRATDRRGQASPLSSSGTSTSSTRSTWSRRPPSVSSGMTSTW